MRFAADRSRTVLGAAAACVAMCWRSAAARRPGRPRTKPQHFACRGQNSSIERIRPVGRGSGRDACCLSDPSVAAKSIECMHHAVQYGTRVLRTLEPGRIQLARPGAKPDATTEELLIPTRSTHKYGAPRKKQKSKAKGRAHLRLGMMRVSSLVFETGYLRAVRHAGLVCLWHTSSYARTQHSIST